MHVINVVIVVDVHMAVVAALVVTLDRDDVR